MIRQLLSIVLPSVLLASGAQAVPVFVAGWDFSEYYGPGAPTVDGVSLATQVDALYSDFDPTFGAGAESRQYGTLFLDGANGSDGGAGGVLIPTSPQISLLATLPVNTAPGGDVPFGSLNVLGNEDPARFPANPIGLAYQDVSMITQAAVAVTFMADLLGGSATSWELQFAALSASTGGTIGVAWSNDGTNFNPFGAPLNVGTTEQAFAVDFAGTGLDGAGAVWIQLTFNDPNLVIDNVGIIGQDAASVPEAGTTLLLVSGLVGLARYGRRRDSLS